MKPSDIVRIFNSTPQSIDSTRLYKKLENKIEKDKLEKLIFVLDNADGSQDRKIDFGAQEKDGLMKVSSFICNCFKPYKKREEAEFSLLKMTEIFGGDFSSELELVAEALLEFEIEDSEKEKEKLAEKFKKIPPEIINKIPVSENQQIEKTDFGYKVSGEDNSIYFYDSEGNFLRIESTYPNGLKIISNEEHFQTYEFGKTTCLYQPRVPYIKQFTVNNGQPNEATFEIKYNENYEAIDVIPKDENSVININDKNKKTLLGYINSSGLVQSFGENFDIIYDGISVNVSPIFDDNLNQPESIKNEIKDLISEGKIEDYSLRLLDDNSYELTITSKHGLDYKGDGKHTIYSADGKIKTTYFTDGNTLTITREQNGDIQTETYDRREFFNGLDKNNPIRNYRLGAIKDFYSSDFEDLFDLQSDPKEYREEIVASSFKLDDYPEIKKLVSNISDKTYISENEYNQTIDNVEYTIKKSENELLVTVNNQIYKIDLTGIHENIQQTLFNANPKALARIAQQGIKLKISTGSDNGEFRPDENAIYLNPDIQDTGKFLRSLVHETGHSYYTHLNPVNEELESTFKKELEYFRANCGSKNLELNDNCAYAASNVYEMVAECYTLLSNGSAKSEFVIANYFPETLKIVKSMIT